MFLTSLYEPELKTEQKRCIVHPFQKHEEITSEVTEYASDMNVLLSWYNLEDDWNDGHKLSKGLEYRLLRGKAAKVITKYPVKAEKIKGYLEKLYAIEETDEKDIEVPAGVFGNIMGEVFVYDDKDPLKESIYRCGYYLGKFIYILDACDDIETDIKKNTYNPFKDIWSKDPDNFDTYCSELLTMMISECCKAFEMLPIIENVTILRNILYSGVWVKYEIIHNKRVKKNAKENDGNNLAAS